VKLPGAMSIDTLSSALAAPQRRLTPINRTDAAVACRDVG
jgi:hypothetical protein